MQITHSESLGQKNTLNLQARARAYAAIGSDAELVQALAWAREQQLAVVALGEGSNIVLAGDIDALVIRQCSRGIQLLSEDDKTATLRVRAGENWHGFVAWALQAGYYGLENLALIPGTAGAAPIQNIGAYGVEVNAFVDAVHSVTVASGTHCRLSNRDCGFGYRDSVFKRELKDSQLITAVDFRLLKKPALRTEYPALAAELDYRRADELTATDVFDAVVRIRSSKLPDPRELPNAGSFFKNPVVAASKGKELAEIFPQMPQYVQGDGVIKLPAAWMIDHCGWKGFRENGVGVHPMHALVLVNYSAQDGSRLLALADKIQRSVQGVFDIGLEVEPRVYGQAQ